MGKDKKKRVVYYSDPLNDDFAQNRFTSCHLKEGYRYYSKNPLYRFFGNIVYFGIALPILWVVGKLWRGVKVKGKKKLKHALKGKGAFLYGNHTHTVDGFLAQAYIVPGRRTYIIAGREAFNLKGLGWLLRMLGILPIPETVSQAAEFMKAVEYHHGQKSHVVIFPEAHIWRFYNGIRPFKENSFVYPAKLMAPVVPFCVTYRGRKIFKNRAPLMTCHVGSPVCPDPALDVHERAMKLRDACYSFMVETASQPENYEYISYVRRS